MKILYHITIIFWLTVCVAVFTYIRMISVGKSVPEPVGGTVGCILTPGIFYLIRYFVGKKRG